MELQLSKKQMDKISYESMLLRMSPQQLYVIAPHLFLENITSANTEIKEEVVSNNEIEEISEKSKSYLESLEDYGGIYGY